MCANNKHTKNCNSDKYLFNIVRFTAQTEPVKTLLGMKRFSIPSWAAKKYGYLLSNGAFMQSYEKSLENGLHEAVHKEQFHEFFLPNSHMLNQFGQSHVLYVLTDLGEDFVNARSIIEKRSMSSFLHGLLGTTSKKEITEKINRIFDNKEKLSNPFHSFKSLEGFR